MSKNYNRGRQWRDFERFPAPCKRRQIPKSGTPFSAMECCSSPPYCSQRTPHQITVRNRRNKQKKPESREQRDLIMTRLAASLRTEQSGLKEIRAPTSRDRGVSPDQLGCSKCPSSNTPIFDFIESLLIPLRGGTPLEAEIGKERKKTKESMIIDLQVQKELMGGFFVAFEKGNC